MQPRNALVILSLMGLSPTAYSVDVDPFADSCFVVRGDVDHSGGATPIDISDLTYFVDFLFVGGAQPVCLMEGDIDASGELDISDLTWLVDYMFQGGPEPPPEPGKDYVVYVSNLNKSTEILSYQVLTGRVDSILLPLHVQSKFGVSSDGKTALIASDDSTGLLDLSTELITTWLPYASTYGVESSSAAAMIVLLSDGYHVLSGDTYDLLFSDTITPISADFSLDGEKLYIGTASGKLRVVDLSSGFAKSDLNLPPFVAPVGVRAIPDTSAILTYLSCGPDCGSVEKISTMDGTTLAAFPNGAGFGDLVYASGTSLAYFTTPAPEFGGIPCTTISVLDIWGDSLRDPISTNALPGCVPGYPGFAMSEIVVTPDGGWLICLGWSGVPVISIFSVGDHTLIDCQFLGTHRFLRFLVVQSGID